MSPYVARLPIIVTRQYDCGCGYRTVSEGQAINHVGMTGHSMKLHGKIVPEGKENDVQDEG